MLLRLLPVSALVLSTFTAADKSPGTEPYSLPGFSAAESHTVNLTCTECAFASNGCSSSGRAVSFLTITFALTDDSLLVNNATVFPPSLPMQFQANRHWISNADLESVPKFESKTATVSYELDTKAIPSSHQQSPVGSKGDIHHLTLSLFDAQGRAATERLVSIGLVREPNVKLAVVQVEETIHRVYHHQIHKVQYQDKEGKWSWWRMNDWKSYSVSQNQDTGEAGTGTGTKAVPSHCPQSEATADGAWKLREPLERFSCWFGKPGFTGLTVSALACVVGYLVGKAIVRLYEYFCEGRAAPRREADPESDAEEAAPESEKKESFMKS
ncbi:uncharacterized protein DSM5745_03108 [Aspergillus mulundensis]|uniref:Uncharacterized protein n=1 Tax=Aspergillus mulundensis TaxID=1810919 RepID=A0A3D8SJK2_9EURO|nr:hypothetical protein DSM5745_03108 [Aspergillus mulundensis]RDW86466.1 hypothetical protein DSM5745_03108 [Aspergillus mulundensis]